MYRKRITVPDFRARDGRWARSISNRDLCVTTLSGLRFDRIQARCSTTAPSNAKWYPTYATCINGFADFQDFAEWHMQQIGYGLLDWHLDKDILVKGSKVYSRNTCALVPEAINNLFVKADARRGDYPIGVYRERLTGKFAAKVATVGGRAYLGTFGTPEAAFTAYRSAKEAQIKEVAQRYREVLDPRVLDALMRYEVEITD